MDFYIVYKTTSGENKIIGNLKKEQIENAFDKLFENKEVVYAGVGKKDLKKIIFYHSVYCGTYIIDDNYEAPKLTKKGNIIMVFGTDGKKYVKSKYPRCYYNVHNFYDGELNINDLLKEIE